jgi:endogenous inhibitor of DNA gyrase (YacG/DUF329 family)
MSVARYHPFCSGRCANVDLHRWLGGAYAIPTNQSAPEETAGSNTDPAVDPVRNSASDPSD